MRAVDLLGGTEILPREDCIDLLRQQSVGRLGMVVDGHVEIFPVNYSLDGEDVLIATNAGHKLGGLIEGEVAFEVDRIDPDSAAGCSVVVHGTCRIVEPDDQTPGTPLPSSWTGTKSLLVRITGHAISGRRVVPRG